MKLLFYILLFSSILCTSCEPNFDKTSNPLEQETPETIVNSPKNNRFSELDIKGYRLTTALIEDLFKEALAKDKSLDSLYQAILTTQENTPTGLRKFDNYKNENNIYFGLVHDYLKQLKDSILQENIQPYFDKTKSNYLKRIATHQKTQDVILAKKEELRKLTILFKLFTTEKMMRNYQQNELPKLEDLKALERELKRVIQNVEEVAKPLE